MTTDITKVISVSRGALLSVPLVGGLPMPRIGMSHSNTAV